MNTAWIQARVRWECIADGVSFGEAGYWRDRLREYAEGLIEQPAEGPTFNREHVPGAPRPVTLGVTRPAATPGAAPRGPASAPRFPFADRDQLLRSLKGAKPQDLQRMDTSPNSEDYVTWALVCAWWRSEDSWPAVLRLAAAQAPGLETALFATPEPDWEPWRRVPSPRAYEQLSRQRMAASADPGLRGRAADPRPVEGESEIDLVIESPAYLVFVEAKLGSDVSLSTKYDPTRNQLVRVIDCALEQAAGRPAAVWMFVRDRAPDRTYVALVNDYRRDPARLHRLLPHRTAGEVEAVSRRLAVVTWGELLDALRLTREDPEMRAVLDEVRGRL